jgi:hypothetical protein
MKRIECYFVPELLNELNNFKDQRPPNSATPIGLADEHEVTELASKIKEIAWENLCLTVNRVIENIRVRFPRLVNEVRVAQLSSIIGQQQIKSGKESKPQRDC